MSVLFYIKHQSKQEAFWYFLPEDREVSNTDIMKPLSEPGILVRDTIITENERVKLHKKNTLQDK